MFFYKYWSTNVGLLRRQLKLARDVFSTNVGLLRRQLFFSNLFIVNAQKRHETTTNHLIDNQIVVTSWRV
jgi:hypothetical protein